MTELLLVSWRPKGGRRGGAARKAPEGGGGAAAKATVTTAAEDEAAEVHSTGSFRAQAGICSGLATTRRFKSSQLVISP